MLFLIVLIVLTTASDGFTQPILEIPSNSFKLGYTPHNSTVWHTFWFKSTGTDTVEITDVNTGCKCAVMPLERTLIGPGDSMKVSFFWNTGRRVGAATQHPNVRIKGSEDPLFVILIGQMVNGLDSCRPVSIKPYKFELGRIAKKSIDSISFKLFNHSGEDVSLKVVSTPFEECEIYMPDSLLSGSEAIGYVKVRPEFADLEFKRSITVEISDKRATRLTIPIRRKFY
ncbi:MAG: DUF1573 domain-containing protein [candidate division Zixibacteria bacterium]|nr:DUF1573 domain-containing protein [candidate division Zixibacteria bacterium]